jgi:hypothetical protein
VRDVFELRSSFLPKKGGSVFIGHAAVEPLIYGIIVFAGIWGLWRKVVHLRLTAFVVEAGVFWLVFKLHGGTLRGGMAAAVAALLAGVVLPRQLPKRLK